VGQPTKYRIVIDLLFGIQLVKKEVYWTEKDAMIAWLDTPMGFRVVPEHEVKDNAITIPLKRRGRDETRRN